MLTKGQQKVVDFLKEVKSKYSFYLNYRLRDGEIRTRVLDSTYCSMCPLTLMAFDKLGVSYPKSKFVEAGEKLGISEDDCCIIACSADNYIDTVYFNEEVRASMLQALELKDVFSMKK